MHLAPPRHPIALALYRLCHLFTTPTREEELRRSFYLGIDVERRRHERQGHETPAVWPYPTVPPIAPPVPQHWYGPTGSWSRHYFNMHPESRITAVTPAVRPLHDARRPGAPTRLVALPVRPAEQPRDTEPLSVPPSALDALAQLAASGDDDTLVVRAAMARRRVEG